MQDYKITYRVDGQQRTEIIVADSIREARFLFERVHPELLILKIETL